MFGVHLLIEEEETPLSKKMMSKLLAEIYSQLSNRRSSNISFIMSLTSIQTMSSILKTLRVSTTESGKQRVLKNVFSQMDPYLDTTWTGQ